MNEVNQESQKHDDDFYKAKIKILERELAEKTRILETTSQVLCDSQKQYQQLLSEFQKIKNERENSLSPIENQRSSDDFIENAIKSRQRRECYNQPLAQLQDFDETIKKLSAQMNNLKRKNEYQEIQIKKWENFAQQIFNQMKELVSYDQIFPNNDLDAQKFLISDLIRMLNQKMIKGHEKQEIIQSKYERAKAKLFEVQKKCDKMLLLLETNGIDFNSNRHYYYE